MSGHVCGRGTTAVKKAWRAARFGGGRVETRWESRDEVAEELLRGDFLNIWRRQCAKLAVRGMENVGFSSSWAPILLGLYPGKNIHAADTRVEKEAFSWEHRSPWRMQSHMNHKNYVAYYWTLFREHNVPKSIVVGSLSDMYTKNMQLYCNSLLSCM